MGEAALGRVVTGGGGLYEADPPFDFAQGRLFGDDQGMTTREAKARAEVWWLADGLHPTLRDGTAKDGAPVLLWLAEITTTADP
jgi:hypothetical protein